MNFIGFGIVFGCILILLGSLVNMDGRGKTAMIVCGIVLLAVAVGVWSLSALGVWRPGY
jgi:hypothetical protein